MTAIPGVWGLRFPNPSAFTNLVIDNVTLIDLAPASTVFPFEPLGNNANQNVSATNVKVYLNNWPAAATNYPGFEMAGNQMTLQAEIHFAADDAQETFRGVFANQGSALATNSDFDIKLFGWRQFTVNFATAPASGATGGASNPLASPWTQSTGTYFVTFTNGNQRYALLTNGSTAVGSWGAALTSTVGSTASAGGALAVNYANYRNRIGLGQNGPGFSSRLHVVDVSNGLEQTVENGLETESWTQSWVGTPTGSSFATPISFPASFGVDRRGWAATSLDTTNGLTGVNVGWSGSTSALVTGGAVNVGLGGLPAFAPVTSAGTPILLTPVGGTFGTTGTAQVVVRGTQMFPVQ